MSRNCRRSSHPHIEESTEEEEPAAPAKRNANRETRLRSRSVSSRESVYRISSETTAGRGQSLQRLDVAEGSEAGCSARVLFYNMRSPSSSLRFPRIYVASQEATGEAKEDITPAKPANFTEPISELPYIEPKDFQPSLPNLDKGPPTSPAPSESSYGGSYWQSADRLTSYTSSRPTSESSLGEKSSHGGVSFSGKDEYDREEPLVTKTQKRYKKRPTLIPRLDDSEETLRQVAFAPERSFVPRKDTTRHSADTDSPGVISDYTAERRAANRVETPSSSDEPYSPGGLGHRYTNHLGEGMVFVYMVIPPDGGYGWLIMVISFLCQLIVDGIILTIGSILPDIEREFKVAPSRTVLVASIQIGSYFLSGAFASILINRFAFRPVAITGAILSMLAIVAGSFSPSLFVLILLYSACGGCALSLIWCSSQLIVACYFERYRPLANGFSCSGAGAGTIIFSLLNNWLVPIIGWRYMLRIQAAAVLLVMLMAIAYVEVRPVQVGVLPHNDLESSSDEYYGNFYVHDYLRVSPVTTGSMLSSYDPDKDKSKCCPCCRRCLQRRRERKEQKRREQEQTLIIRPSYIEREDLFYTGPADYDDPQSKENIEGREIHLVGSDKNIQQVQYGIHHIKKAEAEPTENRSTRGQQRRKGCSGSKFMVILSRLFDYHLFKQFEFKILVASAFLYPMGFNIPFVYSKARTTIPRDYAILITPAIGFTNFTVRNICGFVAYKRRNWTRNLCGGGLVFGGCFVFASAFFGKDLVWFQILYGLCYGVAPAVYSTLRAIIYVKYLGLAKLTNAFGITALSMGIGVFTGTTIAGILVGSSNRYSMAFIFAGLCLVASGMLKLLLPYFVECHDRRKKNSGKGNRKKGQERAK